MSSELNDNGTVKDFLSQKITLVPLGDLIEYRSNGTGSLIVIVQKQTVMVEAQVLVVKMKRRHIQVMFSKES